MKFSTSSVQAATSAADRVPGFPELGADPHIVQDTQVEEGADNLVGGDDP